jgi:hypothetical protein
MGDGSDKPKHIFYDHPHPKEDHFTRHQTAKMLERSFCTGRSQTCQHFGVDVKS